MILPPPPEYQRKRDLSTGGRGTSTHVVVKRMLFLLLTCQMNELKPYVVKV